MEILDSIISKVGILNKMSESVKTNLTFCVNGAFIGEKVLSVYNLAKDNKVVFVASDQIEYLEMKESLENLKVNFACISTDLTPPTFSYVKNEIWQSETISNLYNFAFNDYNILLINSQTLLYKFHSKLNKNNYLKLNIKQKINMQEIINNLILNGYKKCQKIEKTGEFTVKGDILDVYLNNYLNPIRIDFFDDEIDNIYEYDLSEMQKLNTINELIILPNKMYNFDKKETEQIIANIKTAIMNTNVNGDALVKIHTLISQITNGISDGVIDSDIDFVLPFVKEEYLLYELLPDAKFIISSPKRMYDDLQDEYKSVSASIYDFVQSGELLLEHQSFYFSPEQAINFKPAIIFSNSTQNIFKCDITDNQRTIGARNYVFDYKAMLNDLFIYERSNYKIIMFAGSKQSKQTIGEFLTKYNIFYSEELKNNSKFQVIISEQTFNKSCSFLDAGIIIFGTDDLVKKTASQVKNLSSKNKRRNAFYLPKVGEYVVHTTHGIGKCIALTKMNLNGTEKDYFVIEYAGGDKLYLPSEQADLISAYMGGDAEPKLHKIGGEQFAKIKEKVKESVSKLAIDLLDIYAQREKSKGFVYSPDNYLYNAFENAFPYSETEDQLSAIADIKKDMESPRIMDRLICGDVGYGKTEVALRAIYKAVLDGKQVAFLCPTTILSEQHYHTCKERFKDFMVNVQVLNRFKTKAQQEQILKDTLAGKVDVLVGTHRLLSNDVVFKDLSLIVLDEEQRFGVGDKEKIKDLKKNIDVLTLSATPIPRTLNMALTGIRDISIIETPPKERIAVKTYVAEESDTLILDACKKEIARGGQVLYVFNRVEHIYEQAKRLQDLMPNARIGVAHGQMPEKLLEETILNLYNGEYDILVATTLIESGIDLPLANTLIVIDSDRLGLSELYQLRGRIGRSNRTAYAYFTYNPSKLLTQDAYKRLDAIMEYTELGSGFKIAMRDLEIRGAGNILGKEQHGHLEKVGYDMYCKLLEEAVKELKGEKIKQIQPIKMDIAISANLPEGYVSGEDERINLYSKISSISTDKEFEQIENQLKESYGLPPKEAINLLKIAYLKNICVGLGVKRVLINVNSCKLYLYKVQNIMPEGLAKELSEHKNGALSFEDTPVISFDMGMSTTEQKLDFMLDFCKKSAQNK